MQRRTVLVSVPVLLLAAACTGKSDGEGDAKKSNADPKALLDKASKAFADAKTVAFTLSSDGVPKDANGVSAAKGSGVIDATTPKFKGEITGRVSGLSGSLQVIAIGADMWMKFFTPDYQAVDPASLGAPNPASFFHPDTGLPALVAATTDLKAGSQKRQGKEILTEVSGKLPADKVAELLKLGSGNGEYDVTYGITDKSELRTIKVSGDFYGSATSTYSFVLKDYGKTVEITKP